jgi:hypothetical protein
MEYELMGNDGKPHGYFNTRDDAIEALREEEEACPQTTAGWMLVAYEDDAERVGEPELAEELLATPGIPKSGLQFVMHGEGVGLFMPVPSEGSSGKVAPIRRGFRRPPSDAIRTPVPSEA